MTVCSMTPSTIIKFWKTLLNKRNLIDCKSQPLNRLIEEKSRLRRMKCPSFTQNFLKISLQIVT